MALVKVITGGINRGKTTTAKALVAGYRKVGFKTAGFLTDSELIDGRKSAYYLYNIENGQKMISACSAAVSREHEDAEFRRWDFSGFCFNQKAFDFAAGLIDALISSDQSDRPYAVFIDEIGPLELAGEGHLNAVLRLLENFDGTIILVIREALLNTMLQKLGLSAAEIEIIRPPEDYQV